MKVLSLDEHMSNADVLDWAKNKRKQHAREDAEDKKASLKCTPRPQNFLDSLAKQERHLKSDAYPYEKNPSAYEGANRDTSLYAFNKAYMTGIQVPLAEKYKKLIREKMAAFKEAHKDDTEEEIEKYKAGVVEKAQDDLGVEQDKKDITETELLMIHNHAPTCVEMLQPMLESVEDRFALEEQQIIVDCIKEVYRVDELKEEVDDLTAQLSASTPFGARDEKTAGESVDYTLPFRGSLPLRPAAYYGPDPSPASGPNTEALGRANRLE